METGLKEEGILPNSGEQWSGSSCRYLGDADSTLRQCAVGMWEKELGCRGSIVPRKRWILGISAGGTGSTHRVVFTERTLESGLPHCSAPGVPFTLGKMGVMKRKVQSSVGVRD